MRAAAVLVFGVLAAQCLPTVGVAGSRGLPGGDRGGFRTPGAFHARDGLVRDYRSPGRFHARDSLASRGVRRPLPSDGFVSWAPLLAVPPVGYVSPPAAPEVIVAPVTQVFSTVYVSPPAVSLPPDPVASAPAPSAPPAPTVVEHPTGRYELRGDGVSAPHVWVWIPHPPSRPPPSAAEAPQAEPARSTVVYRWTDQDGTTFLTNRPEAVPEVHGPGTDRPASPGVEQRPGGAPAAGGPRSGGGP